MFSLSTTCIHPLFYTYVSHYLSSFFFFNDTAPTEIYTLSLHDALPISWAGAPRPRRALRLRECRAEARAVAGGRRGSSRLDRKSTRLNSSHPSISYAVFCLKKKKKKNRKQTTTTDTTD